MSDPTSIVCVTSIAVERDTRNFQIGASLARFGYRTTVVEGERSRLDRSALPFDLVTTEGAAEQPQPGGGAEAEPPNPAVRFFATLGSFLRENRRTSGALPKADLYYLTYWWQAPAVLRAARRHDAAVIYDANDAYWSWPAYQANAAPLRALFKLVERRTIRRADGFITVGEGVAAMLEERYGRRPVVIRNARDPRLDVPAARGVRSAAGVGNEAFVVVIAANMKPTDTVEEPIEALTRLPDRVHLVLLGRGYEPYAARARSLGVADRVHILPPVPPAELTATIRDADAALINARGSITYGFPTRLFSSVIAGLPLLYPPLPEVVALAEEHELGLPVDAEDPGSIASGIEKLVADPELAARYRANAERAASELSWEREESRLREIVERALHRD